MVTNFAKCSYHITFSCSLTFLKSVIEEKEGEEENLKEKKNSLAKFHHHRQKEMKNYRLTIAQKKIEQIIRKDAFFSSFSS